MANVLITGCSSGFGLLTALEFARKGDTVFATMRTPSKGAELKATAEAEKLPVTILPLDILDDASVAKAVAEATKVGPIDVLVNNAGMEVRGAVEDVTEDEARSQLDTNVFGTMRVTRAVLPAMRARKSGTIVNVSSVAGVTGVPYAGYYSASKHALEAISETMHYELSSFGVRVVLIQPGAFTTSFGSNAVTSRNFNEKSPYWDLSQRFQKSFDGFARPEGAVADPRMVAIAIYDAVHDDTPKLRYPVGSDAQLIVSVRKQLDFEAYEGAMRQTLNWHE